LERGENGHQHRLDEKGAGEYRPPGTYANKRINVGGTSSKEEKVDHPPQLGTTTKEKKT